MNISEVVAREKKLIPYELSPGITMKALNIEEGRLWFIMETPDGLRHTTGPSTSFQGCNNIKEIALRALEYGTEAEKEQAYDYPQST